MTFSEYRQKDATELIQLIKQGAVKPSELMELAIQRTEDVNPKINAIIDPLFDYGRQKAKESDTNSPFGGIPFLLKDLGLAMKGQPTRSGISAMQSFQYPMDSHLVEQFERQGLSIFGKTNTPEMGLTPFTEPKLHGPSFNPWNLERTTGGSSGGSAAAIAAGIVPLATASDGGGSIRIPASCCGLFGLKPSRGRLSLGPFRGEMWEGAVVEGCDSRSVRDSALFLDSFMGAAPGEPYFGPKPLRPFSEAWQEDPKPLKIAFSTQHTLGAKVDPACIAAVEDTVKLLTDLGHQVEETSLPYQREDLTEIFIMMVFGQVAASVHELSALLNRPILRGDIEEETYALYLLGQSYTAGEYAYQKNRWNEVARRIGMFHQQYDLLLTPTLALAPFKTGALQPTAAEQKLVRMVNRFKLKSLLRKNVGTLVEKIFAFIPWTPFANMTGQPSMTVPLYWDEDGLPIGSMFTAAIYQEDILFQLAGQLERARPWANRLAPL